MLSIDQEPSLGHGLRLLIHHPRIAFVDDSLLPMDGKGRARLAVFFYSLIDPPDRTHDIVQIGILPGPEIRELHRVTDLGDCAHLPRLQRHLFHQVGNGFCSVVCLHKRFQLYLVPTDILIDQSCLNGDHGSVPGKFRQCHFHAARDNGHRRTAASPCICHKILVSLTGLLCQLPLVNPFQAPGIKILPYNLPEAEAVLHLVQDLPLYQHSGADPVQDWRIWIPEPGIFHPAYLLDHAAFPASLHLEPGFLCPYHISRRIQQFLAQTACHTFLSMIL